MSGSSRRREESALELPDAFDSWRRPVTFFRMVGGGIAGSPALA